MNGMGSVKTRSFWDQRVGIVLGAAATGMVLKGITAPRVFAQEISTTEVGFAGISGDCKRVSGTHKNGSLRLRNRIIQGSVSTNGSLSVENVKIQGDTRTNGSFTADNAEIQGDVRTNGSFTATLVTVEETVGVNGRADLQSTHVKGTTSVNGVLRARRSHFDQDITLSCKDASFENCQVNSSIVVRPASLISGNTVYGMSDVVIIGRINYCATMINGRCIDAHKMQSEPLLQVIDLSAGTRVSGNIIFEGGKGEVHISDASQIQGQVIGGEIIQKG